MSQGIHKLLKTPQGISSLKKRMPLIIAAAALLLWGQAAAAGPFGQLRGLCEPGKSVLLIRTDL